MKTNLTSLEIHYLVKEIQFLVGGRVDNIYNPKKEELILQLFVSGKGKQILRIISGKLLYLASSRESAEEPSGFCMFLRKHLGNARLRSIKQLGSERIVEFMFEKEEKKKLIVELFGKGNILLCDKNGIILSALIYHKWKDREIKAKIKYSYPKREYNFFDLKLNDLKELFKKTDKNLVRCLAAELGLGGKYSEEVCLLSNVDKNITPSKLEEKETKNILKSINDITNKKCPTKVGAFFKPQTLSSFRSKASKPFRKLKFSKSLSNKKIKPLIIYKNNEVEDIVPFELKIYENLEKKELKKYNEAFDYYFLSEFKEEKPKSKQEKEIERLERIIGKQKEKIGELGNKEIEERKKADLIYENYELINGVLEEMKKAVKKYDWKEIEKRLKGHKLIKAVNSKDKVIDIEV